MILPFDEFFNIFSGNGIGLSTEQYSDFLLYARRMLEYNEKVNLTRITDPYGITVKHFLDSALLLNHAGFINEANLIDIGTGAGFPAVPLKILRRDISITLLDSLKKRVDFLEMISGSLSLNARCVHARAEEIGRLPEFREKFDIAVSRAVSALPVLCEYCLPFVILKGRMLAMKGPNEDINTALPAVKLLGGEISGIKEYSLPDGEKRILVIIEKTNETPLKYPRNAGQIAKKPL